MATLSELRTLIKAKVDDGDISRPSDAQITSQINSTIRYYSNRRFWFSEVRAALTATANDPIIGGIPSDFKQTLEPNSLVLIDNQQSFPLLHITPLQYDSMDTQAIGRPSYYTYRAGQFELYFYPTENYTLYLSYIKKYSDLVNDSDTNDFTENAERLIEYKTLEDLLRDYRSDYDRASVYRQLANDEYNAIQKETYSRVSTGNLVTENIVDSSYNDVMILY